MEDASWEAPLPAAVESMLRQICEQQRLPMPDAHIRRILAELGEERSLSILRKISTQKIYKSLSGFIMHLAREEDRAPTEQSVIQSPPVWNSNCHRSPVKSPNGFSSCSRIPKGPMHSPYSSSDTANTPNLSFQTLALSELEFRKAFLLLSYFGRNKLENHVSANDILSLKDLPMFTFESKVWDAYGRKFCEEADRRKYLDWDSGRTHIYHCHVYHDGSYGFKGPYLGTSRTFLQRALGDDNVLIVKFAEDATRDCTSSMTDSSGYDAALNKVAEEGILVGLRHYQFFVFKDGGKEEKKKNPTSSPVKCYFVRMESFAPCDERVPYILHKKTVHEARCLFMHVHMVSSLAKYMARLSLILSKTIKLQVNLSTVHIERIEDIFCYDENGMIVCNEEGEPLIHTDGTGFISEDLALKIPKDFSREKYTDEVNFEGFLDHLNCAEESSELRGSEVYTRDPPLLMQVRLFYNGCAVKGTLLLNRKLPERTILVRPSMIKVNPDSSLSTAETFNSLEIVRISHKPRKAYLSKTLIALLSYGGVPKEYFLGVLENALNDARSVFSNKRAALRVALNHGEIDNEFSVARMILSGIPLNEPSLQHQLSTLANGEKKGLKTGRLPISESFYLMGTADPTGVLNADEVCVILGNGQISGKVLVYRNPGLHFGDVHVLNAVYIRDLEAFIGNAKYAIFFSTKGQRSAATEIANGDFDGDTYWVSRNPELLNCFKASKPWRRIYSTPSASSRRPSELSLEDLERELFQMFKRARFQQSKNMAVAADSWLAFMDRLLVLGVGGSDERERMKESMQKLIDIYYDALDAPKSGKKVVVPEELKAAKYPHYMERGNQYRSTSVLGLIYDAVKLFESEDVMAEDEEIWMLPCFEVEIPLASENLWAKRYCGYRHEMADALKSNAETKNDAADAVIKKYKQLLYDAPGFEESPRKTQDIYHEALAIYRVTYEHARRCRNVRYCGFAWRIAGQALCKLYATKQSERAIVCSPSVLREVFN
ncbi:probable RNA-dependent RNA polymerase 5 [Diospyros lotus]|uniref:probable RNA-dependent RNA polymerase 5 n=1 Tax=Diospyros lotus TaxID=55363 RepID=UPI00225475E7|nr:probable RNA-dependent RNA polymerase 5 [Diospyros lotus]